MNKARVGEPARGTIPCGNARVHTSVYALLTDRYRPTSVQSTAYTLKMSHGTQIALLRRNASEDEPKLQ